MSKKGKEFIDRLESIFSEHPSRDFSDEELLAVIREPGILAEKGMSEQILLVGEIVERMGSSEEFKKRVLGEITTLRQKPPPP
jgi:hypothetical protein